MDARRLAAILIAACNQIVEELEKELSADKDGGGERDERSSRRERPSRAGRGKDDDDRGRGVGSDDEPGEDDIVRATRAALKVLEEDDVKALIKKHGKAGRATEVKPEHRQAVIDALEKAVDEAQE